MNSFNIFTVKKVTSQKVRLKIKKDESAGDEM